MPLDDASVAIVAEIDQVLSRIGTEVTDPVEVRRLTSTPPEALVDPTPVGSVEDRRMTGANGESIPIRVYRPLDEPSELPPVMVFCHGGGWVFGDLDGHDALCRQLANRSGCVVIAVDYRLAPEHRFPAPLEDAYAAMEWVSTHGAELRVDSARLVMAGDSAGGNLAAAATLLARDRRGPAVAFQLLVYPVLDADFTRPSYTENATGYLMTTHHMRWFWDQYADETQRRDPLAAPVRALDLTGLPPTHIVLAEYDVLRDEGLQYARQLRQADVPTSVVTYAGAFHGFFGFGALIPVARQAFDEAMAALRSVVFPTSE